MPGLRFVAANGQDWRRRDVSWLQHLMYQRDGNRSLADRGDYAFDVARPTAKTQGSLVSRIVPASLVQEACDRGSQALIATTGRIETYGRAGHKQPHSRPPIFLALIEPGGNVRHDIAIKGSVEILSDVSDVRSCEYVFEMTERLRWPVASAFLFGRH